jgi:hypothetical protein
VGGEGAGIVLRVRCGDGLRALKPFPALSGGVRELDRVLFVGPASGECRLLVDDEPLTLADGDNERAWAWQPGFYAGEVSAELLGPGDEPLGRWRLDVSPDPAKLGGDMFREMVSELLDFDPTLVLGQEPARARLGALGDRQDPLVALTRLRGQADSIVAAFEAVVREPIRNIRPRRQRVPLHAARRIDRTSVLSSLRQPALLAVLADLDTELVDGPSGGIWVDVPEIEQHLDSAANRSLLAMLQALGRRCADTRERLEALVSRDEPSETVTSLGPRWARWRAFLDTMQARLASIARHSPFKEVTRAEVTGAGLNAISAHPLYARAWRHSWLALRTGIDGTERDELLPLSPTWEIYERWCYMRLLRLLQQQFAQFVWRRLKPPPHGAFSGWETCGPHDTTVQLLLQPRFPSSNGIAQTSFWSISRERCPDIVLWCQRGDEQTFVVLDAKYRVSRSNVLDAMGQAHIYQDSLRLGARRPEMSMLLVPTTQETVWLSPPPTASVPPAYAPKQRRRSGSWISSSPRQETPVSVFTCDEEPTTTKMQSYAPPPECCTLRNPMTWDLSRRPWAVRRGTWGMGLQRSNPFECAEVRS